MNIDLDVIVWKRKIWSGEFVEEVLTKNKGTAISVCHEAQGESVAIRSDKKGFFTVSEAKGEDKSTNIDIPTYYYSFTEGNYYDSKNYFPYIYNILNL